MAARAYYSDTEPSAYGAYEPVSDFHVDAFLAGERIGPPGISSRRRSKLRQLVLMLVALGGGWVVWTNRDHWPEWRDTATSAANWVTERIAPAPVAAEKPITAPDPAPLLQASDIAAAPGTAEGQAVAKAEPAAVDPAQTASADDTAPPDPLPPPKVDPADPYQKRAVAAGLHPDLSRALLERMTAADYRNAGIAIKTALAETPDKDVFTWPKVRKPELAVFEVHFVRGAAGNCRRYVVTITKDGWLTTAQPMEKCGIEKPADHVKTDHVKKASAG